MEKSGRCRAVRGVVGVQELFSRGLELCGEPGELVAGAMIFFSSSSASWPMSRWEENISIVAAPKLNWPVRWAAPSYIPQISWGRWREASLKLLQNMGDEPELSFQHAWCSGVRSNVLASWGIAVAVGNKNGWTRKDNIVWFCLMGSSCMLFEDLLTKEDSVSLSFRLLKKKTTCLDQHN